MSILSKTKDRPLDLIYTGMLTKDGYFEAYSEKIIRKLGGKQKEKGESRFTYHHSFVFNKLSKKKKWEDLYYTDDTLRFARKRRFLARGDDRDNFTIGGRVVLDPFSKENYKQLGLLSKKLIENGIDPKTKIEVPNLDLPKKKAPYQRKVIGTLEDFIERR